jgi:hypothetical protein
LENQGTDWLRLSSASVEGIHPPTQVKLYGLSSRQTVVGWIQDKRNAWRNVYEKGWVPVPVSDVRFPLEDLTQGRWHLLWWDTQTGLATDGGLINTKSGSLSLSVPTFRGDIAFSLNLEK